MVNIQEFMNHNAFLKITSLFEPFLIIYHCNGKQTYQKQYQKIKIKKKQLINATNIFQGF